VKFRGRQDGVLGVHRERDAIAIVGNHPECVRSGGHQDVIADRKVLHHALPSLLDFRPAGIVYGLREIKVRVLLGKCLIINSNYTISK